MFNIYLVIAIERPMMKKDEEEQAPKIVLEPKIVAARSEQDAAIKTVMSNDLSKFDRERIEVIVRPF